MPLTSGYIDLQVNGYVGIDFNDPTTSLDQIVHAAKAMKSDGVVAALPTIITADLSVMTACIGNVVRAMIEDETAASLFQGLHIEGPFFPPEQGYIGAHPPQHALASSLHSLHTLLDAAQGRARLLTLAPEVDLDGNLTRLCIERGCVVAAGHTNARVQDFERCIEAGLTLFTHLGNGCPRLMDRHDNIIYRALNFRDQLSFTLIADSFHIPELLFRLLLDLIAPERVCVVSDAISATGLGPGVYQLGGRTVRIGPDKAARDASGEHFVGAASSMRDADVWLEHGVGLDESTRDQLLRVNPRNFCPLIGAV